MPGQKGGVDLVKRVTRSIAPKAKIKEGSNPFAAHVLEETKIITFIIYYASESRFVSCRAISELRA